MLRWARGAGGSSGKLFGSGCCRVFSSLSGFNRIEMKSSLTAVVLSPVLGADESDSERLSDSDSEGAMGSMMQHEKGGFVQAARQ